MTYSVASLYRRGRFIAAAVCLWLLAGCIYQPNIQQGNFLDQESLDQVEVGMSKSAVRFLLGTPTITDAFHPDRWDYPYYMKVGRSDDITRSWVIVYFDGEDRVARIEKDVTLEPRS